MKPPLALASLALLLVGSACVSNERGMGVVLATDPPGATVLVDGTDSGFLTPVHLGLPLERARIDMVLDGYQPATVMVAPGGQSYYLILWEEAYISPNTWRFPLWLNYRDGLAPIKLSKALQPGRIFVPLRLAQQE